MVKIIFPIIFLFLFSGCGKRGDIPSENSDSGRAPAKIDRERIYKF